MNLMLFFKEYMKNYEGLDDYLVEIDGQSMYEWNYEDGCLFVGASRLYKLTGDREYLDFIVKMVSPYITVKNTIWILSTQGKFSISYMMRRERSGTGRRAIP